MKDSVKQAVQIWCSHFVDVFKPPAGESITLGPLEESGFFEFAAGDKWIEQKFSPASGTAWLYIPENTWEALAVSGEQASGAGSGEQVQLSGFVDTAAQSFSAFTSAISAHAGRAMEPSTPKIRTSPPPEVEGITAQLETAAGTYRIGFIFNSELMALISQPAGRTRPKADGAPGLDLFLDVELPITVLIGSTKMPLRDVLNLTTGSIIELDRLISDPVDIFVNRRLIARGEVVVIEGNYGVRILEVVSRSERLALRDDGQPVGSHALQAGAGVA